MGLKENKCRVLVESRRFCALCERQKGVKIEVHHITQKSEGGSDDFWNLIPLCFDCHSEVKSYNPEHPKGNKFSEKELRERLVRFYHRIENNEISSEFLQSASLDDYCRRVAIEEDFREIATIIRTDDLSQPGFYFFNLSDLLEQKYMSDSFFAKSSLLSILEELSQILAINTSATHSIKPSDPINAVIFSLRKGFIEEYERLFFYKHY